MDKRGAAGFMGKVRFILALWAAKLSVAALRLLGFHANNRPGMIAMRLCPHFMAYMAKPATVIAVTGTNGKTTVANLLCDALTAGGLRVRANRGGYNLYSGIASALLPGVSLFNRCKYDAAVLEIDEHATRYVLPDAAPDLLIITNLFRDSLMRNAHAEFVASRLDRYIPRGLKLLLNADDLISCRVAPENPRSYFGIERLDTDRDTCVNRINDVRICPKCAGRMEFEYVRYHHIGRARCADCGFASPGYDYSARADIPAGTLTVTDASGAGTYKLLTDAVFDMYNLTAVVAALRETGMDHARIARCLENVKIAGIRRDEADVRGVRVINQLAKDKNAIGCSRVFDYLAGRPGKKELLLMMNSMSDEQHWSENVCWYYDCDYEFLARPEITHIVCAGPRYKDMKLRLLLAGVPEERISLERDELAASELLHMEPGSEVYLLYGTDTTDLMYKVREHLIYLSKKP